MRAVILNLVLPALSLPPVRGNTCLMSAPVTRLCSSPPLPSQWRPLSPIPVRSPPSPPPIPARSTDQGLSVSLIPMWAMGSGQCRPPIPAGGLCSVSRSRLESGTSRGPHLKGQRLVSWYYSELPLIWTPEMRPPLYSGHFKMSQSMLPSGKSTPEMRPPL